MRQQGSNPQKKKEGEMRPTVPPGERSVWRVALQGSGMTTSLEDLSFRALEEGGARV